MNSTELYILAGQAICEWGKTHGASCVLEQHEGVVVCLPLNKTGHARQDPLVISPFEIQNGMSSSRWNEIGSALHNLFCKEKAVEVSKKTS